MERSAQAVDIGTRRCLHPTILLGCGIANRTKGNSICELPWLKMACDTKINQIEMPIGSPDDIIRFEVAKDDGRLPRVQAVQHCTKLYAGIDNFLDRQISSLAFVQILFQCNTIDEVHDEIPASGFAEMIVNTRHVRMH